MLGVNRKRGIVLASPEVTALACLRSSGTGQRVLLTDQRLVLVRTSGSSPPRSREAPAPVPRGDVSVTSGHGFFGTTSFLTLTTPVTATPLRLTFDGQYVPAATAVYLSLASEGALTSLRLPPPDGPALADSRTRAILRRYRYGAWLVLLPGVAIFTLLGAGCPSGWGLGSLGLAWFRRCHGSRLAGS